VIRTGELHRRDNFRAAAVTRDQVNSGDSWKVTSECDATAVWRPSGKSGEKRGEGQLQAISAIDSAPPQSVILCVVRHPLSVSGGVNTASRKSGQIRDKSLGMQVVADKFPAFLIRQVENSLAGGSNKRSEEGQLAGKGLQEDRSALEATTQARPLAPSLEPCGASLTRPVDEVFAIRCPNSAAFTH
jgi:hypothetical protein